jgi:hypothetical protein
MSVDDDFLAEIESAAEVYESRFFVVCSGVVNKEALISEVKRLPQIAPHICLCGDGSDELWLPRSEFRINELNQWLHMPCGKLSPYSIYTYCLVPGCRHMFFTNKNMNRLWPNTKPKVTECSCHGT